MRIHELKPAKGSVRKRKRIGRGEGSKKGGTAGRGHKGHKSRSGYKHRPWFEGGQMPIYRRLPKRGFNNARFRKEYNILNLKQLSYFAEKYKESLQDFITPQRLQKLEIIKRKKLPLKILGDGELTQKIEVYAHKFSKSAKEKIEQAGAKLVVIPTIKTFTLNQLSAFARKHEILKEEITPEKLAQVKLIPNVEHTLVRIINKGELKLPLTIQAHEFAAHVEEKIEQAGGKAITLPHYYNECIRYFTITLNQLNRWGTAFSDVLQGEITPEKLIELKLIGGKVGKVVLNISKKGKITLPLTVHAHEFEPKAAKAIESAGGKVMAIKV